MNSEKNLQAKMPLPRPENASWLKASCKKI